jgi:hypothetical protein
MARGETRRNGYLKSLRRWPLPTPRCATCRCCTGKRALARTCLSCCLASWGQAVATEPDMWELRAHGSGVSFGRTPPQRHWWSYDTDPLPTGA